MCGSYRTAVTADCLGGVNVFPFLLCSYHLLCVRLSDLAFEVAGEVCHWLLCDGIAVSLKTSFHVWPLLLAQRLQFVSPLLRNIGVCLFIEFAK